MSGNNEYVTSFSCLGEKEEREEEERKALEFFRDNGFVVIRDALSPQQIEETLNEIWGKHLLGKKETIKRDDPSTWSNNNWPSEMGIAERGFLTADSDYHLQASWNNRQNINIHRFFSLILNTEKLWVKVDRYGVMRPTVDIKMNDHSIVNRPEWITKSNWLHWDQNPWNQPNFVGVQGLVTFVDSTSESGGFHCVPGFHHHFSDWASKNEKKKGGIVNVPLDDPIRQQIKKITMKAGSLVIWDSRLPHGNYPNLSSSFRMVQYITFFPVPENEKEREEERMKRLEPFVDASDDSSLNFTAWFSKNKQKSPSGSGELTYKFPTLTDLGEKILGVHNWKKIRLLEDSFSKISGK